MGPKSRSSNRRTTRESCTSGHAYGAAYAFHRTARAWSQVAYLKAWNGYPQLALGTRVAASAAGVAVSTTAEHTNAAGVFDPFAEGGVPPVPPTTIGIGAVSVY